MSLNNLPDEVLRILNEPVSNDWSDLTKEDIKKHIERDEAFDDVKDTENDNDENLAISSAFDLIKTAAPPDFLINNIIEKGAMTMIAGQSGAFKSFVALDLAWSVSSKTDFLGNTVFDAGKVLYVCGEGKQGIGRRLLALNKEKPVDQHINLNIYNKSLDISCEKSMALLSATLITEKPDLVIFDTFSSLAGGINENDNSEVSSALKKLNSVTEDAAVIIVHHFGKNKDNGMRGASAFLANCDAVIYIARNEEEMSGVISCGKSKDGEFFADINFNAEKVGLNMLRQDGNECTSLVIKQAEHIKKIERPKYSVEKLARKAIAESGILIEEFGYGITRDVLKNEIREIDSVIKDGALRKKIHDFVSKLKDGKIAGMTFVEQDGKWMIVELLKTE